MRHRTLATKSSYPSLSVMCMAKMSKKVKSVDETSSEILFKTVYEAFKEHDIDVMNLRGQCYDGTSNVSGCYTGLQARLKESSNSAMFVHCYAHVLTPSHRRHHDQQLNSQRLFQSAPKFVRLHPNMYKTSCSIRPEAS